MSDLRINGEAKSLLKSVIGGKLIKYRHDPFTITPSFTIQGEVFFEDKILRVRSEEMAADFFEAGEEEISALFVEKIAEEDAMSACIGIKQIDFPVGEKVKDIWIVDEKIQEFVDNKPGERYDLTRGVVFILEDMQLGFEKDIWLSVEIYPHKGDDVLKDFQRLGADLNGWPKGCMSKNKRTAYSLLDGRVIFEEANETGEDPLAD